MRAVVRTPWPVYALDSSADGSRAVVLGGGGWGVLDLADLTRADRLVEVADLDVWARNGTGTSLAEVAPDGTRAALLVGRNVLLVDLDTTGLLQRRQVETEPPGSRSRPRGPATGRRSRSAPPTVGSICSTAPPSSPLRRDVLSPVGCSPTSRSAPTARWPPPSGRRATSRCGTPRPGALRPAAVRRPVRRDSSASPRGRPSARSASATSPSAVVAVDPHAWVEAACQAARAT